MIPGDRWVRRTMIAAVFLLSALVYFNSLFNQFTNWDDAGMVLNNRFIVRLTVDRIQQIFTPGVTGSYQPLRNLSYAIDYHFWRYNPFGYHLANVILFGLNSVLVFYVVLLLFKDTRTALAASFLFAVHPVHCEAVAWIAGRKEALSGLFFLGAFVLYVRSAESREPRPGYYGGSLALFICALGSKATCVTLPAMLVLYDLCFLPRTTLKDILKRWRVHVPFWALTALSVWVNVQTGLERGAVKQYVAGRAGYTMLTMATVFVDYVRMLFIPVGLRARYLTEPVTAASDVGAWLAVAALVLLLTLGIVLMRRSPGTSFSILWFLIALAPVSNIIPLSTLKADRYLYLPSVGFCILVAFFCTRMGLFARANVVPRWRARTVQVCFSSALVLLSLLTVMRNKDWKDSITIWNVDLKAYPRSFFALNNLGLAYSDLGEDDKAVSHLKRAIQIVPAFPEAYANLGNVYFGQEKFDEAEQCYNKALSLNPDLYGIYNSLGMIYERQEKWQEAIEAYRRCITGEPYNAETHANLGLLLYRLGQFTEAVQELEKAVNIKPDEFEPLNNLGLAYCKAGRFREAISVHRDAIKLKPESASAHYNLANALVFSGAHTQAESEYLTAIELETDPLKNADAYGNLGNVYVRMGLLDKALESFNKALERNPELGQVYYNIGAVHTRKGEWEQAIAAYRSAMRQTSQLAIPAHMSLANVYVAQGEFDRAKREIEEVLKIDSDFAPAKKALDMIGEMRRERSTSQ